MGHECIIGLWSDYDYSPLVTLSYLIEMQPQTVYTMAMLTDNRYNTCLRRFVYCPECGKKLIGRQLEIIIKTSNMDTVLEYLPGQLKCENCIYNDNCETKWKRCVANYVDIGNVVYLAFCDKKFNKEVADEVVKILNDLNK